MEQTITTLIGNLGFPIAVTIYLLVFFKQTLDKLIDVIANNTKILKR
jgi:hypothetical protein